MTSSVRPEKCAHSIPANTVNRSGLIGKIVSEHWLLVVRSWNPGTVSWPRHMELGCPFNSEMPIVCLRFVPVLCLIKLADVLVVPAVLISFPVSAYCKRRRETELIWWISRFNTADFFVLMT